MIVWLRKLWRPGRSRRPAMSFVRHLEEARDATESVSFRADALERMLLASARKKFNKGPQLEYPQ